MNCTIDPTDLADSDSYFENMGRAIKAHEQLSISGPIFEWSDQDQRYIDISKVQPSWIMPRTGTIFMGDAEIVDQKNGILKLYIAKS